MYGRRESPRAPRPDLDAGWCAEESRSRGPPREVEHEGQTKRYGFMTHGGCDRM